MTQTSISFRMPFGVPGDLSKAPGHADVIPQAFGATAFGQYGIPVVLTAGLAVPVSASGNFVYGFLVRPFPITGVNASDALGTSVPPISGQANVMLRGWINVQIGTGGGSPAALGAVYVRYANGTGNLPIGGIEATSVGGSNSAITSANSYGTGAFFTGPADSNGICEVAFNI